MKRQLILVQLTLLSFFILLCNNETVHANVAKAPQLQGIDQNTTTIYLNGVSGNDANDGTTTATAVKTFAKAKELATTYQGITTIFVTGTVPISGDISLAGTNAIIKREAAFNGFLLNVALNQTATLSEITIDGNSQQATGANLSLINARGTLNIKNGTILQNNHLASTTARREGGAILCRGCTINMTAGIIQNNTANWGGGIMLKDGAKFNMSGGTIQDNHVINGPDMAAWNDAASGGGVCLYEGATFNLSGSALLQNNTSEEVGGGISVGTMEVSFGSNLLVMTGGTINGNTSGATGGGIFIQAAYGARESKATITGGYITNNGMLGTGITNFLFGGGGIYVNGYDFESFKNGELFLKNAVITDNEAEISGGGYAGCPISETKVYLTEGGAFYQNRANEAKDIYLLSATIGFGAHGGNPEYFISNTMLGGVPYHWKYSDGTEVPLNKLFGILTGEGVSLGLYTDETGNANTANLAKVFITGNTSATRGGGIGSNGNVTIGTEDETTEIAVSKNWDDEDNKLGLRPESIEIELWRKISGSSDDPVYIGFETIKPDVDGNWSLTFLNLPANNGSLDLYEYSIRERVVSGYSPVISGDAATGFEIINRKPVLPDTGFPVLYP